MHTTAIRQEGIFDKDMIVVHLDERTNKYRVLLEPKRATTNPPNRDGMNNTLILPSMKMMYGEDYVPTTPPAQGQQNRRHDISSRGHFIPGRDGGYGG